MMHKLISYLLLTVAIISCTKSGNPTSKTTSIRPNGNDITIEWGVIENSYKRETKFLSELTLVNNSQHDLASDNWALYFNFNACRPIYTDSLPDIVNIEHINGDFFKLTPTKLFPGIEKGDKISIPIVSSPWAVKNTDIPGGFYFIFNENGKDSKPEASPFKLSPAYASSKQIDKTKDDNNIAPTPADIFADNNRLSIVANQDVQRIVPTPVVYNTTTENINITHSTVIRAPKELTKEANFLANALKQNLGTKLSISSDLSVTANSIVLTTGSVTVKGEAKKTEAYNLTVSKAGISIIGSDQAGVFYGIQSLRALLPVATYQNAQKTITLSGVVVEDAPGFEYRGMHLDVARNFQSKESVIKLLDMMAFYKLNKFHFHLVDDEGWRLAIDELPELTQVGSKRGHTLDESDKLIPSYGSGAFADASISSGTGFYTRAEFIEILKYATERHIEVIPELDMPGHARAAIKSMNARYKKYMAEGKEEKAKEFLLADLNDKSEYASVQVFNDNVVCVCQNSTYKFLETVLDDMIEMYKEAEAPLTTIHSGGDEVPHGVWEKSPVCDQLIKENPSINNVKDIKEYFISTFSQMILDRGLKFAGWEEIGMHIESHDGKEVKTINPKYADKGFVPFIWNSVYGWGGEEVGYKLANQGYPVVLSNVTNLYFDMAYDKRPEEPGFYWGGFINDEKAYLFEPYNIYNSIKVDLNGNPIPEAELAKRVALTAEGRKNIKGIQGQLWSETVMNPERLEYMIYPRLICLGERAWNPTPTWTSDKAAYVTSWNAFANALGQREMPRMDYFHNGVSYRIPTPGAMIENGTLKANIALPGLVIRYTTDGTEPTTTSMEYKGEIKVTGTVKLKAFSTSGNSSRTVTVQ
ncbi:carbohydate-binding domain-containing protein [Cyclobacteriaceae bacterium]|nr:carbohydate-binding domain-containing protein [Cyclobacteriaceae bacterium]